MYLTFRFRRAAAALCAALLVLTVAGAASVAGVRAVSGSVDAGKKTQENTETGIRLPIVMYHGVLKEASRQGKYVISPDLLESDMKYLQANGYTPVNMQELLDYVDGKGELPEKPILLTFDDGYYNNYLYAFPLAKQYQMKIVIAPIGYYTDLYSEKDADHPNYSHVTWDQVKEMMDSGVVEFQNHTYNLHASDGKRLGAKKLKGEGESQYQTMLKADLQKFQEEMKEHTGYTPTTFVYPFGAISASALPVIKELGMRATLTCESKMNFITRSPDCLFGLGRTLRPTNTGSEAFFKKLFSQ